jgi:hypothetical protein
MVQIPKESRSINGVSPIKLVRNLIAAFGIQGIVGFDINPKRLEAGLEKAILFGRKKGMKFNFELMLPRHLYSNGSSLGILYCVDGGKGIKYRIKFKNKEDAREYIKDSVRSKEEITLYQKMAAEFFNGFGNSGLEKQRRHRWAYPGEDQQI